MPLAADEFLPNPASIKRALRAALKGADKLDMAVAFVGKDWDSILGRYRGRTRLVCWLSSTNTNPTAVEEMMKLPSCKVRQVDAMHAKVYLPRGGGAVAIVGSANLSARALADEGTSIQFEAAVLVLQASVVEQASAWFEELWEGGRAVDRADIAAAKVAWKAAQRGRSPTTGRVRDGVTAAQAEQENIDRRAFLADLVDRPGGQALAKLARSVLEAAAGAELDVRWNPRSFSVYSAKGKDGLGLFLVELHKTYVHLGVWRRQQSREADKRIDAAVADVLGAKSSQLSPQRFQYSFRFEQLRGNGERLVERLVAALEL